MKPEWLIHAEKQINADIEEMTRLSGGDFAESFSAQVGATTQIFIKTHRNPPAHFFSTEANGLERLANTGTVNIPKVLCACDQPPYIALQWIEPGHSIANTEQVLGREMALLHQSHCAVYGRPDQATTGSLALPNTPCQSWADFYANQRLLPLAKLARDRNALPGKTIAQLETVASILPELEETDVKPSLLHGDLWAGNRIVDQSGRSWLIDPAAHGGHREFDLAMMRLFSGYEDSCFHAYKESFPLQPDWQSRIRLHQIAPLVVHAIKFGGSYRAAASDAIKAYC